ncbi:MAG: hypothetical protein L6R39_004995 [Caloplaca ligustica]|nr:MAG: hypothetical protein L6R39_004995 [Caloplaca ligustica]
MVGLRLDHTPAQPSHLRNVYMPRSPASPLESIAKRVRRTNNTASSDSSSDSGSSTDSRSSGPPPSPYRWMWYCHQCHTGYELGVTRRCLIDDHELCYGQPVKKRSKKGKKKQQACQSEFDYTGWQSWGAWRRTQAGQKEQPAERNCFAHCEWPSQCRWDRKEKRSAESNSQDAVQEYTEEASQEAAPRAEEVLIAAINEDPAPKAIADSPLSSLASAARNLTSRWTSLLAPIEEEPSTTTIDEFLDLAIAPAAKTTEQVNPLRQNPPTVSSDFDFGFPLDPKEEEIPSVARGLHDLAALTLGIALFAPSETRLAQDPYMYWRPSLQHRRCVSAPVTQKPELQDQLPGGRRMSA